MNVLKSLIRTRYLFSFSSINPLIPLCGMSLALQHNVCLTILAHLQEQLQFINHCPYKLQWTHSKKLIPCSLQMNSNRDPLHNPLSMLLCLKWPKNLSKIKKSQFLSNFENSSKIVREILCSITQAVEISCTYSNPTGEYIMMSCSR